MHMHMYICISDDEIGKLPKWEDELYLPTSNINNGRSIELNIYDEMVDG